MKWLGVELYTYMVPPYVQSDLRAGQLFLEIGMDEALLNYPWELMHDGQDFLCLKHAVGRYVNAKQQAIPMQQRPASPLGTELETLSVLLISVPRPAARPDGTTFEALPEAEAETDAILDILGGRDGVEVAALIGKDAEYSDVFQALKTGKYHIIHFNGHARFNDKNPYLSGLVLHDRNMTTGPLTSTIGGKPPLLCFVNGCETARSVEPAEPAHHFDIYGLARAFLDTGAYLLGSRWKVQDATASTFAQELYRSLVEEGEAIGNAILKARHACREQVPGDPFGWASYLYYGDPRVAFGML
jgi:CHAT domain-containing protein